MGPWALGSLGAAWRALARLLPRRSLMYSLRQQRRSTAQRSRQWRNFILLCAGFLCVILVRSRIRAPDQLASQNAGSTGSLEVLAPLTLRVALVSPYLPELHAVGEWSAGFFHLGVQRLQGCGEGLSSEACPMELGLIALRQGKNLKRPPPEVEFEIRKEVLQDYLDAADYVNKHYDIVSLQHENTIFGGTFGDFLFPFLDRIRVPVQVCFHTLIGDSTNLTVRVRLREILKRVNLVTTFVPSVCSEIQALMPGLQCSHIPYGFERSPPAAIHIRRDFASVLDGRRVILSTGLISSDKGFEYMIKSMVQVSVEVPDALYVIAGGQQPGLQSDYLSELETLVDHLHLHSSVVFVKGQNLLKSELLEWMQVAEIVVVTNLQKQQISSGIISMAMGFGKAVVASSFRFAEECICNPNAPTLGRETDTSLSRDGIGTNSREIRAPPCWTVPFVGERRLDQAALTSTVLRLLTNDTLLMETQGAARASMEGNTWEEEIMAHAQLLRNVKLGMGAQMSTSENTAILLSGWDYSTLQTRLSALASHIVSFASTDFTMPPILSLPKDEMRTGSMWLYTSRVAAALEAVNGDGQQKTDLTVKEAADGLVELLSHRGVQFSRWLPREASRLYITEFNTNGPFYGNNRLAALHGDLSKGLVLHSSLSEGLLFGWGVSYTTEIVYIVHGRIFSASTDKLGDEGKFGMGETSKNGDRKWWSEAILRADKGQLVGKLRVEYVLQEGMMAVDIRHELRLAGGLRVDMAEIVTKIGFGDRVKPRPTAFYALTAEGGQLRKTTFEGDGLMFDSDMESEVLQWDVITTRAGEDPVFTFLYNGSSLRSIRYKSQKETRKLLSIAHHYDVTQLEPGAVYFIQERRLVLSRAELSKLASYGEVLSHMEQWKGFDLTAIDSQSSGLVTKVLSRYANSLKDTHHKGRLLEWLMTRGAGSISDH